MNKYQAIQTCNHTILIAERNSRIGALLEKAFLTRGYPVCVAANGYDAAKLLVSVNPALVVLDPDLPYLFALLEAGKGILVDEVPVVVHALSSAEDSPFAFSASRTVCKDADPEQLILAVETTLGGQPVREEPR